MQSAYTASIPALRANETKSKKNRTLKTKSSMDEALERDFGPWIRGGENGRMASEDGLTTIYKS